MKKTSLGFTLVEIIVVLGLVAILLIISLSGANEARIRARDTVRVSDIEKIRLALEEYRAVCGVYPATLAPTTNNARVGTCSVYFGDLMPQVPTVPAYSVDGIHAQQGDQYLYVGLSNQTNGPCYDYHIGVQLEYGANNNYSDGENGTLFADDHDYNPQALGMQYGSRCHGTNTYWIPNAHDDSYGFYDFRSAQSQAQ